MNGGYKYTLEPYSGMNSRFTCPQCKKKHNFVRYIDVNRNYVGEDIGRCNSEISCGYHRKPSGNTIVKNGGFKLEYTEPTPLYENEIVNDKVKDNLFIFLSKIFGYDKTKYVFDLYNVCSTDKKWQGSTIFYQIDKDNKYHTGKIINYNKNTGKRVKEPYNRIYWVHKFIKDREFTLQQCLFGENLLSRHRYEKLFLVESEKTCLIAKLRYPNYLFLASGGLSNLSPTKIKVLDNYNVIAIPDKCGYDIWLKKLNYKNIKVSNMIEKRNDLNDGEDLADLILKLK